jgi:hypothetical protein
LEEIFAFAGHHQSGQIFNMFETKELFLKDLENECVETIYSSRHRTLVGYEETIS